MTISKRMQQIKPSATLAITAKARALKAQGIDVVDFSAGEPDFDTPAFIREACIKAINAGYTRYTPVGGIPELKAAVCAKLKRENDLNYTPDEIIITNGIKQAIFTGFQAILNPGDEVIIPAPYWVSYPDQVRLAEGVPVVVQTTEESGLKITAAQLEAAITPKTRVLILTSPSNPTGSVYTADEFKPIIAVCKKHNLFILTDEIYEYLVYDTPFISPVTVDPSIKDNTLLVNGLSKSFAMTGWRVGFAAGPKDIIKAMEIWQSQSLTHITSFVQHAAVAALNGPRDEVLKMRDTMKQRRDFVVAALKKIPNVRCGNPQGAFYVFPNFSNYIGKQGPSGEIKSSQDLADYLLTDAHVATVPGEGFGAPGFLRISYASSFESLQKGVERIATSLAKLS